MPVHRHSVHDRRAGDQRYAELRRRLVAEWQSQPGGTPPLPDISEETDRQGRIAHVTVTWDAWDDLDAQTRSELIVDAFQLVHGEPAIVNLTLAMGLTTAERARLEP